MMELPCHQRLSISAICDQDRQGLSQLCSNSYLFTGIEHLASKHGAENHLDVFGEGIMVKVVAVDAHLVGIGFTETRQ